ncbi:glycosyltransferase family 9 protein [Solwaraspora sp. WMMD406]|uniref:glycosyltransferase family 9 protein n=1 Tax=Solwaraspora sp. WMMD406 TaxID=3016095 RepID=UPI0024178117|nr:glycosyltransferase family 9 protein [Solwaraspora sp. WMMD406]MDG4763422.1 glycosyltransferase family 9 protein [Solwaraspora sp. WMMD406]
MSPYRLDTQDGTENGTGKAGEDRVPDVRRIAVLRANALGDFIFALPALTALRAAYPQAELVLLGAPWHARWLAGRAVADRPGLVDRVLVVPAADGIRAPEADEADEADEAGAADDRNDGGSAMTSFLAAARREEFDLALQLHGGGRNSNPLVAALGARVTAGLRAVDAPPLDRWIRYVFYQPEVFRYLEVAALVGADPVTVMPSVPVTNADRAEADRVLGPADRPRVVLHPGASDPRRRWPADRFAAVADVLTSQGFEVLVTGIGAERDVVEQVSRAAAGPVRTVVDQLSLGGLAGLLAGCAAVVSNDTGPLHLAAAVGTPTVGIYWIGNLLNGAPPLRGRHRPLAAFTVYCPVCGLDCSRVGFPARGGGTGCGHRESFVTDVPVAEVLEAVAELTGSDGAQPDRLRKQFAYVVAER